MTVPDPGLQQRDAADAGASVWVAASAGTGKTKVLTDRVLALMLGGSEPSRILCLTFTRAAAAEMANRIGERLSAWATLDDGRLMQEVGALTGRLPDARLLAQARRLFARVLDAPGGLRIETLHAFCQSLLRRFPLEAGVVPHFELMDERSATEALAAARDEILTAARDGSDGALAAALSQVTRHASEGVFETVMAELVLDRARLAQALAGGSPAFAARLGHSLGVPPGTTEAGIVTAACDALDEGALADAARALLGSPKISDKGCGTKLARWLEDAAARAERFDDYLDIFFTLEGKPRKDLLTKGCAAAEPRAAATLAAEAARLEDVVRRRQAAALLEASAALATLGAALLERYAQHKTQRALLDYDDLILGARDLLRRPGIAPWVLFKLDGGLDHILIDEAQDTNPEQWAIVQALADEFFSGAGARAPGRTIFAVGDAKQSIYSFQRADPLAFLRMHDHFAARVQDAKEQWRRIELGVSFRSTAAVLGAVDAVFSRPEAAAGVALDGAAIRHYAHRVEEGGIVELWPAVEPEPRPEAAPWEPPLEQRQAREAPARLARAIAATLRRWLDNGERLAARGRRMTAGDVLVLVRRRGPFVTELVRALKQRDVDVAGADRMRLTDQLAVQDMLALLQFLLLPEDDLTLATVLKGPLIDFDDDLLFTLAHPRQGSLWIELLQRRGENPRFAAAAALLGDLLSHADYRPPYELLAELLGARGGRRAMLARLGPEAADPLDELLSAALAYERRHGPSLQGFLHWIVAGDLEVKRDWDQRGRDELRIMTVHGAKGLQAPVVFLPDTMQPPRQLPRVLWTPETLPLWRAHRGCLAPALERAQELAARRRDEEYRRLLYVALTRAEDRLYVCGWQTRQTPPADCWYGLVQAGLTAAEGCERFDFTAPLPAGEGWSGTGWRLVSPQRAKPRSDERVALFAQTTTLPAWVGDRPPPEPTPPRPLAPSRPDHDEPPAASPLESDGGTGYRRGRLVHRLLQSLPQLDPAARAAAARRFLALPIHGLPGAVQEEILGEIMAVLEDADFAPLFAPGSQGEVPVVGLIDGRALSGRIDRLVVTDAAVLIVDYKTLRPAPRSEAEVPPLYLEQLRAYRAAMRAIYPDRPIRCALLWTDGPRLMQISDAGLGSP